jgi:glycosyltransferase involved in cell wall biosynthesis
MRVAVVIPAYNEESSLPRVLRAIPRDLVQQVVVVDNGSTDATPALARAGGAMVVREPRRGYGSACLAGLRFLRTIDPDVVVFLDADYSDHPEEMPQLVGPLREPGCDLVVGSRVRGRREKGALPLHARFGNLLATRLLWLLYGERATDLGPFRAARYRPLMDLGMRDRDFGWTVEMQARAARAGWKILEVPVSYRRRIGRSKITGTISGSLRAGVKILITLFRIRFFGN